MSEQKSNPRAVYEIIMRIERERQRISDELRYPFQFGGYGKHLLTMRFVQINAVMNQILKHEPKIYLRSRYSVQKMFTAKNGKYDSDPYVSNLWYVKHAKGNAALLRKAEQQFVTDTIPF